MSRLSAHIIASYGSLCLQPRVSLGSGSLGHKDMRKNVQKKMCEKHNIVMRQVLAHLKASKFIHVLINRIKNDGHQNSLRPSEAGVVFYFIVICIFVC